LLECTHQNALESIAFDILRKSALDMN